MKKLVTLLFASLFIVNSSNAKTFKFYTVPGAKYTFKGEAAYYPVDAIFTVGTRPELGKEDKRKTIPVNGVEFGDVVQMGITDCVGNIEINTTDKSQKKANFFIFEFKNEKEKPSCNLKKDKIVNVIPDHTIGKTSTFTVYSTN